jgi:ElaB/YqjD/DUF883 family membrane-anchored ribosome-binding protein
MSTSEMDRGNFEEVARRELHDDGEREPQAIERDIDATRADMRATLEALERRFSFERLVDMTVGRIRDRGGEFAGNLTEAATQNPMPLLLTSIGLGWMMLASRRGSRSNSGSYYSDAHDDGVTTGALREGARSLRERAGNIRDRASHAADKVHGAMDSTRETMHGAMGSMRSAIDSTRETVGSAMDSTRETWRHAAESSRHTLEQTTDSLRSGAHRAAEVTREQAERVNRLLHEQPLMLGALGLAAGAIIGALLPTTEHEGRMVGDMRNKAMKEVAQKSRAKFEAAREQVAAALRPEGKESSDEGGAGERQSASRPH